ncbi:hypothetical protein [Streptosporangium sp. NPDC048865]|uniref:hypothetical protein n=1 Tax=Streptosporangium sp. NPDC048865 TaxID=3155766 RepID=UPI003412F954
MVDEQEPTKGELARTMSRFENALGEIRHDIKSFAEEWRSQGAAAALLTLRVDQLEAWKREITREFDRQDERLDVAERDLYARQDTIERRRRTGSWWSIGIAAFAAVVALVGLLLKLS